MADHTVESGSFVGRQAELTALRGELAAVRSGRPRVVLLEGPPGIGKTAVLDRLLDDESDLTVLRATGEQWEAFVAYGVVDQLMRVAGVSAARLRAGRDRSLPVEEPVGVGARILEALAELEQKTPWPSSSTTRSGPTSTRSARSCSSRAAWSANGCWSSSPSAPRTRCGSPRACPGWRPVGPGPPSHSSR